MNEIVLQQGEYFAFEVELWQQIVDLFPKNVDEAIILSYYSRTLSKIRMYLSWIKYL